MDKKLREKCSLTSIRPDGFRLSDLSFGGGGASECEGIRKRRGHRARGNLQQKFEQLYQVMEEVFPLRVSGERSWASNGQVGVGWRCGGGDRLEGMVSLLPGIPKGEKKLREKSVPSLRKTW